MVHFGLARYERALARRAVGERCEALSESRMRAICMSGFDERDVETGLRLNHWAHSLDERAEKQICSAYRHRATFRLNPKESVGSGSRLPTVRFTLHCRHPTAVPRTAAVGQEQTIVLQAAARSSARPRSGAAMGSRRSEPLLREIAESPIAGCRFEASCTKIRPSSVTSGSARLDTSEVRIGRVARAGLCAGDRHGGSQYEYRTVNLP